MELVKCSNGHFYDGEKYSVCPHCNSGEAVKTAPPPSGLNHVNEDATMPIVDEPAVTKPDEYTKKGNPTPVTPVVRNAPGREEDEDDQTTVSILEYEDGKPVVGWLVCVEGGVKGRSYELYAGMNFIGRNRNNHICVPTDISISREKHGIVIYDPKSRTYLVQSGMSAELLYLNDKVVLQPIALEPYDALLLGETKFLFVPFCGDSFTWE